MAKKKSKKKDNRKKGNRKKDLEKKIKLKRKKAAKKKDAKKKDAKKKDAKKKDTKKKNILKSKGVGVLEKPVPAASAPRKVPEIKKEDDSSKYNATEAIKKLRALKSREELLSFTKNEKRVTVAKVIPAAMKRLKK